MTTVNASYFGPINEGSVFINLPDYTGLQLRRSSATTMPPLKPRISQDHSVST